MSNCFATLVGLIVSSAVPCADDSIRSDKHWAYNAPVRPEVPDTVRQAHNPIDAFVAEGRLKRGLVPVPEAEKHVLLRRVYLDLIGLPPTPEQLHAFLADQAPGAYEAVV